MATLYRERPRTRPNYFPPRERVTPLLDELFREPEPTIPEPESLEEILRTRAYFLWEQAGRPNCDGCQFWLQAQHELGLA
jgi:hypothetical protein